MNINVVAYLLVDAEKILKEYHIRIAQVNLTVPPRHEQHQAGQLRVVAQEVIASNEMVLTVCHQLAGDDVDSLKYNIINSDKTANREQ